MAPKISPSNKLKTTINSRIQKLKNYIGFTSNNHLETKNSYNKITLLGTLIIISIGVYLFSFFYNDFAQFNSDRRSSTFGFSFLILAGLLFALKQDILFI